MDKYYETRLLKLLANNTLYTDFWASITKIERSSTKYTPEISAMYVWINSKNYITSNLVCWGDTGVWKSSSQNLQTRSRILQSLEILAEEPDSDNLAGNAVKEQEWRSPP